MLRGQLHGLGRGNQSICVYLHTMRTIADALAAINERVSNSDLTMYALNGLGREYDNFVISAQNRETPFTFAELKARFLNHAQWLHDQEQKVSNGFDIDRSSSFFSKSVNSGRNNNSGNMV